MGLGKIVFKGRVTPRNDGVRVRGKTKLGGHGGRLSHQEARLSRRPNPSSAHLD